jgi:hypothetical protein
MSRAREVSKVISTVENLDAVAYSSASPSNPDAGDLWIDSDNDLFYVWNGSVWASTMNQSPFISSIGPSTINNQSGNNIGINGNYFESGCYVVFIGTDNSEYSATATQFYNSSSVIAVAPSLATSYSPYDVKIINPGGNFAVSSNSLAIGSPYWNTATGNISTINDRYGSYSSVATISASDPNSDTVTYSASGLPSGMTINSNTGVISGDPADVSTSTTYTFTATASDTSNNTANRNFNIIINPTNDGSSSTRAAVSATDIFNLGITTNGNYWIKGNGSTPYQMYCILDSTIKGGKWMRTTSILRNHDLGGQNWYTYATGSDYTLSNTSSTFNVPPSIFGNQYGNDLTAMFRVVGGVGAVSTPGTMFGAIYKGGNLAFAFNDSLSSGDMANTSGFSYSSDGVSFTSYTTTAMTHANGAWNIVMAHNGTSGTVGHYATSNQTSGFILHASASGSDASRLYGFLEGVGLQSDQSNWTRFEIYVRKD